MSEGRPRRVCVRYCAGCAPWYDQRGAVRSLWEGAGAAAELLPAEAGGCCDVLLVVLGCPRGAAERCAPCPENLRAGARLVVRSPGELARACRDLAPRPAKQR